MKQNPPQKNIYFQTQTALQAQTHQNIPEMNKIPAKVQQFTQPWNQIKEPKEHITHHV